MDLTQFEGHTPNMLLSVFADGAFTIEDPMGENRIICQRHAWASSAKESIANGRLFAAAPDLLAEVHRLTKERDEARAVAQELATVALSVAPRGWCCKVCAPITGEWLWLSGCNVVHDPGCPVLTVAAWPKGEGDSI